MGDLLQVGQCLRLHFKEKYAYLSPQPIPLSATNLPTFVTQFDQIAHWDCRILRYDKSDQRLYLEVLAYQLGSAEITSEQIASYHSLKDIKSLHFRALDTGKLLMTTRSQRALKEENYLAESAEQRSKVTKVDISIPLSRCTIEFGGLYFMHQLQGYGNAVEVFVENVNLRPEFDAVKSYFGNILGKDTIMVTVGIQHHEEYAEVVEATSADVDRMDEGLIEQVRFEFVRSTKTKRLIRGVDKTIFTMDEYLSAYDEKLEPNTFHGSAEELFADLLQVSDSVHYRQLQYLSANHQSKILKLRFILDPMSFLFLLEGKHDYHVIWETLDTKEATYVWQVRKNKKELKSMLRRLESILASIRSQGKTAYLSARPDRFHRITHDYSQIVDGFIKWRGQLESVLT